MVATTTTLIYTNKDDCNHDVSHIYPQRLFQPRRLSYIPTKIISTTTSLIYTHKDGFNHGNSHIYPQRLFQPRRLSYIPTKIVSTTTSLIIPTKIVSTTTTLIYTHKDGFDRDVSHIYPQRWLQPRQLSYIPTKMVSTTTTLIYTHKDGFDHGGFCILGEGRVGCLKVFFPGWLSLGVLSAVG